MRIDNVPCTTGPMRGKTIHFDVHPDQIGIAGHDLEASCDRASDEIYIDFARRVADKFATHENHAQYTLTMLLYHAICYMVDNR